METERLVIVRGWGEGEMGNDSLMEFPFGVIKMFWKEIKVVVSQYPDCTKLHWIVRFKMVNCMLCEFYLRKQKPKIPTAPNPTSL